MINTINTSRIHWNDPVSLSANMNRISELTDIIRGAKDTRMPIEEYAAKNNMSIQAFYKYKRKLNSIGIDTGHRKLHYRPTIDNKIFAQQNPAPIKPNPAPVIQKTKEPHNICVKVNNVSATFSSGVSDKALFEIILSLIKDSKE